jgi:hypothetical protein
VCVSILVNQESGIFVVLWYCNDALVLDKINIVESDWIVGVEFSTSFPIGRNAV